MSLFLTKKNIVQFIKFGLVGCSNAIISLGIYTFLVYVNVNYFVANAIGFFISIINAFVWNNYFVFKKNNADDRSKLYSFIKMLLSYSITGLFLQSAELKLLIDILTVSKYFAQIICIIVNLPINFVLNKIWAFKVKGQK